jgi:uncharacterized protein
MTFEKLFGGSPFSAIVQHAHIVHECVKLIPKLTQALLDENYEKINELHDKMSQTEHEADELKTKIRGKLSGMYLFAISKQNLMQLVSLQDDIADTAEDLSVVLMLRKTKIHPEIKNVFQEFVEKIVSISELLISLLEQLSVLAEASFSGNEADTFLATIDKISHEEWQADRLQRQFALAFYELESEIDPVTIMFYDKYCHGLSAVANSAERTAKFLRQIILSK